MRLKVAPSYSDEWLEIERPQPLSDNRLELIQKEILSGNINASTDDSVYNDFKTEAEKIVVNSKLNSIKGLETFTRKDICIGCTQFIDNLYMQGPVQSIRNDYRYHERLGLGYIRDVGDLIPEVPLIIAMPFPQTGSIHSEMDEILKECEQKNISVHIDGAWITCSKGVSFDLSHTSIRSFAFSLSKGLGLGWNRIGLRWSKDVKSDSISIMNDFHMNNRALVMIGLHYVRELPVDYLWNTHKKNYHKVCQDFNLEETNSIYLALRNGQPVGLSPLLRYLENE